MRILALVLREFRGDRSEHPWTYNREGVVRMLLVVIVGLRTLIEIVGTCEIILVEQ